MEKSLQIKTKLRFRDGLRYNLYVAYNTTLNYIFFVLSIVSLGMFMYNMINSAASLDVRFTQSFMLLIPPFIFFVTIPVKVWKATVALLENPILKDEVVYIFTKEAIILKTSQGEADVKWESYVRIVETKQDFRLFMDKVQAQIIPKYSLDKMEIQDLRSILKAVVDSKILKLKRV
ncbi:MAG TPA: YcxB family protein [Epulopiscium sp.]|nr:YcxB family protein [Candidatus Epulonipiscium sp.]